ncbi:MAG TPA: hypothetical protein VMM58_03635 [Bacteroidota bacterium]|nr:hypothetical protein [Bacteroidota bacterium]
MSDFKAKLFMQIVDVEISELFLYAGLKLLRVTRFFGSRRFVEPFRLCATDPVDLIPPA